MNHHLKKILLTIVLIMAFCFSSLWPGEYEKKVVLKIGKPYLQIAPDRFIPLIPINIMKDKFPLSNKEILKVNDLQARIFVPKVKIPASYSLEKYQTAIKAQDNRGTCWIFAMVGGLEAFYKRKYGERYDLSEQYANHALKSSSLDYPQKYKYENQSSYWGGGNSHCLPWLATYYIPIEDEAKYKTDVEMNQVRISIPEAGDLEWKNSAAENKVTQAQVDAFEYSTKYIPLRARWNTVFGVKEYFLLEQAKTRDVNFMERLISTNHEVIVDFDLKWKLVNGIYDYDKDANGGGHVMLVIGYDRNKKYFLLKNSWGENNFLKVSYNFMEKASLCGSIIKDISDPKASPDTRAYWLGNWKMEHDGWKGTLIIRRLSGKSESQAFRFGSYYGADGSVHTVNGYFMEKRNRLGVVLFINFDKPETPPGDQTGQRFEIFVYSRAPKFASGYTTWNDTLFGVFLTRENYLSKPAAGHFDIQKWVGTWNMNHDGWEGKLHIESVKSLVTISNYSIKARYESYDGKIYPVSGKIDKKTTHIADIKINFPGNTQSFKLFYHTRDDSFFSGYTTWNGQEFGLHGVKVK